MSGLLTIAAVDLVLWDDDLAGVAIVRTRDGVLQDADRANNLALFDNPDLTTLSLLASAKIARVADHLFSLDGFPTTLYTNEFAISISDNLIDGLVKHVCSAVDGT